jgi:outer membrane protein TolC
MIAEALKNRPEIQESVLQLESTELTRKSERNALLPSLSMYGFISGQGLAGTTPPANVAAGSPVPAPTSFGTSMYNALNYTSPEYQVGFQLSLPLRNRVAKADQYRTELEYRQTQVYLEERKKSVRIEVRNARYALEQGSSRVDAAREARDLAQKTLDIMQKEQKLGAGSNQQTLSSEHDLAVAENALVTAETAYAKAQVQMVYATGSMLETYGISIESAKTGNGNSAPPTPRTTAPTPNGQRP